MNYLYTFIALSILLVSFAKTEAQEVQAFISPDTSQVSAGGSFTVEIALEMLATEKTLGSFSGSLSWNPNLVAFRGHSGIELPFEGKVNVAQNLEGLISFNGLNPVGSSGRSPILKIAFESLGKSTDLELDFRTIGAARTFEQLVTVLSTSNGRVESDSRVTSTNPLLVQEGMKLQVFPNPFEESLTINYWLLEGASISIALFDLMGKQVREVFTGFQAGGQHQLTWKLGSKPLALSEGVYLLRLQNAEAGVYQRVIYHKP